MRQRTTTTACRPSSGRRPRKHRCRNEPTPGRRQRKRRYSRAQKHHGPFFLLPKACSEANPPGLRPRQGAWGCPCQHAAPSLHLWSPTSAKSSLVPITTPPQPNQPQPPLNQTD
eukprot:scaffold67474_cov20-Tisochrysis_lutea.AAC.1